MKNELITLGPGIVKGSNTVKKQPCAGPFKAITIRLLNYFKILYLSNIKILKVSFKYAACI